MVWSMRCEKRKLEHKMRTGFTGNHRPRIPLPADGAGGTSLKDILPTVAVLGLLEKSAGINVLKEGAWGANTPSACSKDTLSRAQSCAPPL
jgi:hypothetical protein